LEESEMERERLEDLRRKDWKNRKGQRENRGI
jgi:hypothetical protein